MISFRQKNTNQRPFSSVGSLYSAFEARTICSILCVVLVFLGFGCSRQHYRLKADKEAYGLLSCETNDPRWKVDDYRIGVDCRSRMFDGHDPDCEPMPADDPTAHRMMHAVDGKKGAKNWGKCGCARCIENPRWRQFLLYDKDGAVVLSKNTAMELALLHSPEYQAAKENLYLSALRVSQERFRFDVQFFGTDSMYYTASGKLRSPEGTFLTNDVEAHATKLFASGGELLVGMANSITWSFAGPDDWHSESLINFNFVQPLLRGAGRRIVLERLTQSERNFLASVRRMAFYQQGFYTRVVGGGSDQALPLSWGEDMVGVGNTTVSNNGFLGLLADQIRIQNQRQNIVNIEENLKQMEEFFKASKFNDRLQVEQMNQRRLTSQSTLVREKASYQNNTETFLRSIGLPPDLHVKVTDPVVESFELMSPSLLRLQENVGVFLNVVRKEDEALPEDLRTRLNDLVQWGENELAKIAYDLEQLDKKTPDRLAGFRALKLWADKEIRNGERLDPSIYDSNLYLQRIATLKEEEDTNRLRAALTLLRLFVNNDESAIRTMFEKRIFGKDVEDAMILLELTDLGVKTTDESVVELPPDAPKEAEKAKEDLIESRERLQVLQEQLKTEEEISRADELTPKAPIREQTTLRINADDSTEQKKAASVLAESNRKMNERLAELLLKPDGYRTWLSRILNAFGNELMGLSILQTRIRLDSFTLTPTEITPENAFGIAAECRLDWMNQRASLVDQWRQLEITANQLRGDLKLTVNGELGTVDKRGVRFDGDNGTVKMGLQWDTPLTRHAEMLAYRRSQIAYQRARRNYYVYVDAVNAKLRQILRDIETSQIDFEIQRNSILVNTSQVNLSQLKLIKPPKRGERFDPTLARDLADGLQNLLTSQNQFLGIWIDNQTLRMQLDLLMGTMQLDERGNWIDPGPIRADRFETSIPNGQLPIIPPAPKLELPPKLAPPVLEQENLLEQPAEGTSLPPEPQPMVLKKDPETVPLPLRHDAKPAPVEAKVSKHSEPPQKKLTSKNAPPPPKTPE